MKLFHALVALGSVALPAAVSAASAYDSIYVRVPFEFVAAGQAFPAGDYRIQRTENGLILIQGSGKAAAAITVPSGLANAGSSTGLKFESDGTHKHLVGVQVEGEATRALPMRTDDARKTVLSSR